MATKKKGKKKPPGGMSGAPPRSEPRVQIFSKFAGCNFQLANRNFDDVFNADEAESQTDLMPMLMAIQNNAHIAPFGGIETRQSLVKLFDTPTGTNLTGVATLIGDELYAACSDWSVRHGQLPVSGHGHLDSTVEIIDSNDTYGEAVLTSYPDDLFFSSVEEDTETRIFDRSTNLRDSTNGVAPTTETAPDIATVTTLGGALRIELQGKNINNVQDHLNVTILDSNHSVVAWDVVTVPMQMGWPLTTWLTTIPFYLPAGTYFVRAWAPSTIGLVCNGSWEPFIRAYERYHLLAFSPEHTVVSTGVLVKLRYSVSIDSAPRKAHVRVYHGGWSGELIYDGQVSRLTDIVLMHPVTAGDKILMVVEVNYTPLLTAGVADFYLSETTDNNNWTFLGYADDQLVGMTANKQIWTGRLDDHQLANGKEIADPAALVFSDLVPVGAGLTISATATLPFRITLRHTVINRFGPTLPSDPLTFYASKPTTEWTTASFVKVNGVAPNLAGVTAVELYYTEGEFQEPAFLGRVNVADVAAPATTKPWSFNWTGYQVDTSMWAVANLTVPTQNYTTGVPASKMASLDGQLYFWGGDPAHRIWVGGNPGNRFSISPGVGGGFVDTDPGTGTVVSKVMKYKTQQGAAIVTALCSNPNSQREARFNLVESSIAISDEQSVKGWMAEKIAGAVGCKSSYGAVAAGDGLYTVSRYGLAITTLTMEYNSQLQVMYVSDPIAPVFLKQLGDQLDGSVLFEVNGILYMTFGAQDETLDNVIFCYDINLKAWWTYTLDTDSPILSMISIDHEGSREGIGIVTKDAVYLLPTTIPDKINTLPEHTVLIESGELTTMQPLQSMQHLAQLELRFDYFIGDMDIDVTMIDQFGRLITTTKQMHYDTLQHQHSEYIRIDGVVESYKIVMHGKARMRMTHFISKVYPKSNRIGMVYGFDSGQSHTSVGSIHRTFNSYNDLKEAIIP